MAVIGPTVEVMSRWTGPALAILATITTPAGTTVGSTVAATAVTAADSTAAATTSPAPRVARGKST